MFQKFLPEESLLKELLSGCAGNGRYRLGVGHAAGCGFGWGVRDMEWWIGVAVGDIDMAYF